VVNWGTRGLDDYRPAWPIWLQRLLSGNWGVAGSRASGKMLGGMGLNLAAAEWWGSCDTIAPPQPPNPAVAEARQHPKAITHERRSK